MKKFLKITAIILVIAMVGVFAACGASNTGSDETSSTTEAAAGNEGQASKDDNVLIMATNAAFPPYEYREGDKIVGIDAEIAAEIAKKLGKELKIIDTEFGSIVTGVQEGKYDIGMAGMTVTEERLEKINFSNSYAKGIQSVIVKADSDYVSYEDFYTGFDENGDPISVKEDIKIGVQQDTTGDIYCSSTAAEWGFEEANVVRYKTGADAVQALVTGKVTAVVIDNEPAKSFVDSAKGLKILDGSYTEEDYAIAVAKENTELLANINKALEELTKDGTIQKIVDKYIPAK